MKATERNQFPNWHALMFLSILLIAFACHPKDLQQKPRLATAVSGKNYLVQDSLLIPTSDGAMISAIVVRDPEVTQGQSSILFHTIYARPEADIKRAMRAVDHGYIGVVSYSRGKALSPDEIMPYVHDAMDTYEIIDWISKQDWSDGQVGMYGGSYVGFTQWAAAKKLHPALKTIVPAVAAAPGIAEPMENGVVANFFYPWPHYVASNKYLNDDLYRDPMWNDLYQQWYETGVAYRALDSLAGIENRTFQNWMDHPDYDDYWQSMIPYKEEFSHIKIPVLSITGYYDGGQIGSLYYLKEHYKYNESAEHYLVIGPYTHFGAQNIPDSVVGGYAIDPVANVNIGELTFDWFEYTLKNSQRPELLENKINYQIMGTNTWGHAATIEDIANDTMTFFLNNATSNVTFESTFGSGNNGSDEHFELAGTKPREIGFISQKVDFADRSPAAQNNYFTPFVINETLTVGNGLSFISEPFSKPLTLSGALRGELVIAINKRDMDCSLVLYQQTPEGQYFKLMTRYVGRSSYVRDRTKRQLLTPSEKTRIPLANVRMTSRRFEIGSRLVVVVNVNKNAYYQINYGSGKDVSDESLKDSDGPLHVRWYNESFIQVPIRSQ